MKISGCIIQKRNIKESNKDTFYASYRGKRIYVSSNHGFGKAEYDHLTRFYIFVVDAKTEICDVDMYEDCHDIREAIRVALKGACFI
ncbi:MULTISPECIES: hypothetical protein [Butyricimonas]|uniref:hypothetical protein n=1 Tax=Butyricimonas TaxID=574697 RepID=UPI0007FB5179|nr:MULTISPECIES: hypothetical protein [Butyricimonas]